MKSDYVFATIKSEYYLNNIINKKKIKGDYQVEIGYINIFKLPKFISSQTVSNTTV